MMQWKVEYVEPNDLGQYAKRVEQQLTELSRSGYTIHQVESIRVGGQATVKWAAMIYAHK